MMPALPSRLLAFASAVVFVSACAEIDTSPGEWSYDGPVNSCGGGCSAGTCDAALGICAVDPSAGGELIARVVPDTATGVPSQVFHFEAGDETQTLSLAAPIGVALEVPVGDTDATASLVGRVIFSDVGNRLPGRSARVVVQEVDSSSGLKVDLLPSTYNISLIPASSQADGLPARYLDGVVLDEDGVLRDSDGSSIDRLVAPWPAATVKGRVLLAEAPVNGLEVLAYDPATGRSISTTGTTACVAAETGAGESEQTVCGYFEIGLAKSAVEAAETGAGATSFSLRILRPSESNHPVFTAEGFDVPESGGALDLSGDARLAFGPLGVPERVRVIVSKPVADGEGGMAYVPAPSCFVALSSADVAGGSVEKWLLTDESGEIEDSPGNLGINLYPGDYDLTVIPSHATIDASADYQAFTLPTQWQIPGDVTAQEIRLEGRSILSGTVVAGGKYVPTSAVSAEPAHGAPEIARPNSVIAGNSGRFRLWVDEAAYVVTAEAPAESSFAWDLAEVQVSGSTLEIGLELPLPFVQRGVIEADQIAPIDITGAVVEWYREFDGRAYAIGRTFPESDGSFAALLPP